jgi:hypothetical protein
MDCEISLEEVEQNLSEIACELGYLNKGLEESNEYLQSIALSLEGLLAQGGK